MAVVAVVAVVRIPYRINAIIALIHYNTFSTIVGEYLVLEVNCYLISTNRLSGNSFKRILDSRWNQSVRQAPNLLLRKHSRFGLP